MTSAVLCKLYKRIVKGEEKDRKGFFAFCGRNTKLSPEKTRITRGEHSYTRSYPQYPQKSTTSVVYKKRCQVRMFVLGFVIKSQIKGKKEGVSRNATFLDKRNYSERLGCKCCKTAQRDVLLKQ